MLRPERMSRVSVTGSKPVMDEVVEAVHDLHLLHLTEYDGSWEGFSPGDPVEGADEAAEKLVTVRSLKAILGVDEADIGATNQVVTEETVETELEAVRQEVNELDDRRAEVRDELQRVEELADTVEPFVDLGVDIDLLSGYDSLAVRVGQADPDDVEAALAGSEVDTYELFTGEDVVGVFAYTDESTLQRTLVEAAFTELEVPEGEGSPEEYREELAERKAELEAELDAVEDELDETAADVGPFLLAAEEELTVEVQRREAPLSFATTENAFVAEGWIPTGEYDEFVATLHEAVGEHVEISELEQAEYDDEGRVTEREPGGAGSPEPTAAADGGDVATDGGDDRTAADGGTATMSVTDPPVVQNNPGGVKPFESLVEIINRPKYSELDPTIIMFLTFPLFFGFMIGDLGYGLLYMGIGYGMIRAFDSDVLRSLGGIGVWSGAFTAVFGVLYGEFFGLHGLGEIVWAGSPPIHKGLQPHFVYYAYAWLLLSGVVGVLQIVVGRLFDFVNNLEHGVGEAFLESFSWIIMTVGLWAWVFTRTAVDAKPAFMWEVFATEGATNPVTGEVIENVAIPLGFQGLPFVELFTIPGLGLVMDPTLLVLVTGLVLVAAAEGGIGVIESITETFGHVVSYTRIAAVLLAKAGMALAVNLLVFGATLHDGEFHFIFFMDEAPVPDEVVFSGLVNGEGGVGLVVGALAGVVVLVLGHLLVLVLGITSAGLQAIRLEYVEFFGKFYEGGGDQYLPFGHEREHTTD
ncbi:MAG: V/A-type H+-transporting ATPase subunit I [Natronomonas sp.]|jgi:V/A-type H+-transporting ATPase subunit I